MNVQQYLNYVSHKFRRSFNDTYTPDWGCPNCTQGMLNLERDSLYFVETANSSAKRNEPSWEPEMIEYRFSARFSCNRCLRETFCTGFGHEAVYYDSSKECGDVEYVNEFWPRFFSPSLQLFDIPKACPDSVRKAIESSFTIAWADIPAAGSRLRVAIEKLVDDLIPPRENESLHSKINRVSEQYPQEGRLLLAIKWLGNNASHEDNLRECDLAFGFRALELALRELFSRAKEEVSTLAEAVIKNKGPINY